MGVLCWMACDRWEWCVDRLADGPDIQAVWGCLTEVLNEVWRRALSLGLSLSILSPLCLSFYPLPSLSLSLCDEQLSSAPPMTPVTSDTGNIPTRSSHSN